MSCVVCNVPPRAAQGIYFVGLMLVALSCFLLRDYGGDALNFSPLNDCVGRSDPPDPTCTGRAAVLAICLGSFCFFSLHMVLLLGVTRRDSWRLPLHTGLWPAKLLLWGGACAGFFYVGDTALEGWGEAARVFSAIFIVLQLVIILDFIFACNEWLLERPGCAWALVAATALMIAGSFVGLGFLYHFYAPSASCSLNIWFITSIILGFLLYGAISVSPLRTESAGLFTSACVLAYTTYYCWSALNSEPLGHECAVSSTGANKTVQIIALVIALLALGFSTLSAGTSSKAFDLSTGAADDDEASAACLPCAACLLACLPAGLPRC